MHITLPILTVFTLLVGLSVNAPVPQPINSRDRLRDIQLLERSLTDAHLLRRPDNLEDTSALPSHLRKRNFAILNAILSHLAQLNAVDTSTDCSETTSSQGGNVDLSIPSILGLSVGGGGSCQTDPAQTSTTQSYNVCSI